MILQIVGKKLCIYLVWRNVSLARNNKCTQHDTTNYVYESRPSTDVYS